MENLVGCKIRYVYGAMHFEDEGVVVEDRGDVVAVMVGGRQAYIHRRQIIAEGV